MKKNFVYNTSKNNRINVTVDGFENLKNSPCIIFVHGFKGFKDWGFGPYARNFFAERGYVSIGFNFSHNGVGESMTEFEELDKFAENTFSLEHDELDEVIEAYRNGFFGETDNEKIFLIGHSRGGGISLITARYNDNIGAVAVWASVADFNRYTERQKQEWKERGYLEILNSRTKQRMRMNYSLLEDLEKHKDDKLSLKKAVENLNVPLLIVHGEQDMAVPVSEGKTLYEWSDNDKSEFITIPNSGHTFNAVHPFEGSNKKLEELLNKTESFFKKHLN